MTPAVIWVDFCHKCRLKWVWEEGKDDKDHDERFIEHTEAGHNFTTYDPNTKDGIMHAKLAGVPLDGRE